MYAALAEFGKNDQLATFFPIDETEAAIKRSMYAARSASRPELGIGPPAGYMASGRSEYMRGTISRICSTPSARHIRISSARASLSLYQSQSPQPMSPTTARGMSNSMTTLSAAGFPNSWVVAP